MLLANRENGLYRSTNSGTSFSKISSVSQAYKVSVGKAVTGATYPSIFVWGVVNGVNGIFQSDDQGATWTQMNSTATEFGRSHNCLAGDPRVYGRLYVGAGARGIMYADKSIATDISDALDKNSTSAYPNPFTNSLKIERNGSFEYSLSTIDGLVLSKGNASNEVVLGSDLSKGVYLIKITQNDFNKVIRVVKE